ncbi:MAG TPA: hypothetical protein VFY36_07165 [Solirubrobacteraceae bacterium]|nr:hypothetical protein [Solirubrobacteraceae bacterium]
MRSDKNGGRSQWSFETTSAIDRAVASLIVMIGLIVTHAVGLDLYALNLVSALAR